MIGQGALSLPAKDVPAYKQLAKLYDLKNYKKGIKAANALLELHPQHPETYALRALFELALGEDAKALESAKAGVMFSKFKSTFCWHTYGTAYRTKKDFHESLKCFQFASKSDPQNMQLLRETANLLIQVRDHSNHVDMRYKILKSKPNIPQNWAAFTLAHHLRGDYTSLFKALGSFDSIVKVADLKPVELSHYYLYRVVAFRDAEKYDLMYTQLRKNKDMIKDQVVFAELLVKAADKLGKKEEAEQTLVGLLKKFPQNTQYLRWYQRMMGLPDREVYRKATENFGSKIARVYELSHISDPAQFKAEFSKFIKPYFVKNLISLFAQIQKIYEADKEDLIEEILGLYESALKGNTYPDGTEMVSPSEYVWSLYLLSQHYARHFQTLPLALDYINRAIEHTSTIPEFYLVKAQIEYGLHDNFSALQTVNQARKMDLADRYMNNICVKYIMKCEKPNIGEEIFRLFTREDSSLYELQNQWYIIETGKSLLKCRNFEAGLRHLNFISKQFLDMLANEHDFHAYCLRKWTLREYTELIAFNDNIYDDRQYMDAAGTAIAYLFEYTHKLKQDDKQAEIEAQNKKNNETAQSSSDNPQTKYPVKKKKKKKVVEVEQVLTPLQTFRNKVDYDGKEYALTIKANPMEQAFGWACNISTAKYVNKGNLDENKIFAKAFEQAINVFMAMKKPLLVLRCMKKLIRCGCCPTVTHITLVRCLVYFDDLLKGDCHELIRECVYEWVESVLEGKSIMEFNLAAVERWKTHLSKDVQYYLGLRKLQAQLAAKNQYTRQELILLYRGQLLKLSSKEEIMTNDLCLIFYLTHLLEYYGEITEEIRGKLCERVGNRTSYFGNWRNDVEKLPETTWTMWWLSEDDRLREEKDLREHEQKENMNKGEGSQAKKS